MTSAKVNVFVLGWVPRIGMMWIPYTSYEGPPIILGPLEFDQVHTSDYFVDKNGGPSLPPVGDYLLVPIVVGTEVNGPNFPVNVLSDPESISYPPYVVKILP
jgi:hypothetical protein